MPVKPEDWVGTIWQDKKGLQREVTRVKGMNVYWRRPGGEERTKPKWRPHFARWAMSAQQIAGKKIDPEGFLLR